VLVALFVLLSASPSFAQQRSAPDLPFDSVGDFLKLPAGEYTIRAGKKLKRVTV